jgi:hypothetical protein
MPADDSDVDPITFQALRRIALSWDMPWPEFLEEFRRRAQANGGSLEELAVILTAEAGQRPSS